MKWHPRGFGGIRPDPEDIKREGWVSSGILVVSASDPRLSWPEQELVKQLGTRLFGKNEKVPS